MQLFNIEFQKIKKYKTFWILSALFILFLVITLMTMQGLINDVTKNATQNGLPIKIKAFKLYTFPTIWHNLTFIAGYMKVFIGIILIIIVCNEFSNKTIRHNIINGWSRTDFFKAKTYLVISFSIAVTLVIFFSGLILGFIYSETITFQSIFKEFFYIPTFLLEMIAYLSMVLFIAILVRKTGLTMGLLLLYSYIIEPILWFKTPHLSDFLPLDAFGSLIQLPNSPLLKIISQEFYEGVEPKALILSVVWMGLFFAGSYLLLKKRDL